MYVCIHTRGGSAVAMPDAVAIILLVIQTKCRRDSLVAEPTSGCSSSTESFQTL